MIYLMSRAERRPLVSLVTALGPDHSERRSTMAPAANTVLDLGGGHGEYALEFARRGLKPMLQDRPTMIDILRSEGRVETAGVQLFPGDFFEVLAPGQYDLVFCSGVTHTLGGGRVRELFRRIAPIVAPGGLLAVQTFLRGRHQRRRHLRRTNAGQRRRRGHLLRGRVSLLVGGGRLCHSDRPRPRWWPTVTADGGHGGLRH